VFAGALVEGRGRRAVRRWRPGPGAGAGRDAVAKRRQGRGV